MDWLDDWFQERGGRRGRAQDRTATGGLIYAVTRHGTSRAGDPSPHDHVLVANVVEMLDDAGAGSRGSTAPRCGTRSRPPRWSAGSTPLPAPSSWAFAIEPDDGPSGNLRHWRIVGVPDEVCELFSKRSDEIAEHLAETGHDELPGPRHRRPRYAEP